VEVIRKTLFEGETLQIDLVETRPVSDASGDVERQSVNVVVLPFSGVFSKHDGPGRHAERSRRRSASSSRLRAIFA
jgi:AraC family transcriptional regulator